MAKDFELYSSSREKLVSGVNKLANIVKVTLGPRGQNVAIERGEDCAPLITNDGISIAQEITLKDPYENMGAKLVSEVASKTNENAGDGTTTSTVLTQDIVNRGLVEIENGANPIFLKEGMNLAVKEAVKYLNEIKHEIKTTDDITRVASISSASDEIGKLIGTAMEKMGKDGLITLEDSDTYETEIIIEDGYEIDRGYITPLMITDYKRERTVMKNPLIYVTNKTYKTMADVLPLLETPAKLGRPLLIVCDNIEGPALETIVMNLQAVQTVAVRAPGFGEGKDEQLEDLAIMVGANFHNDKKGVNPSYVQENFGTASKIETDKNKTVILNGNISKDHHKLRIETLKESIENTNDTFLKEVFEKRLAKMNAGIAVIKCGAKTETEQAEKKLRIEDAINATKAALKDGIVAGGGIALLKANNGISIEDVEASIITEEIEIGFEIVRESLMAPFTCILENACINPEEVMLKVMCQECSSNIGFNSKTFKYEDFIESGVIDPVRVTISALENAVSVAGTLLTTNVAIIESREK